MTMIHTITKGLYAMTGLFFLTIGMGLVSYRTGLLPSSIQAQIFEAAEHNVYSLHLLQEFGSLMVFAGLISFWFVKEYGNSNGFHWLMTIYWALMSAIHWADVRPSEGSITGPIINTIPVTLYLITGLMRNM